MNGWGAAQIAAAACIGLLLVAWLVSLVDPKGHPIPDPAWGLGIVALGVLGGRLVIRRDERKDNGQ